MVGKFLINSKFIIQTSVILQRDQTSTNSDFGELSRVVESSSRRSVEPNLRLLLCRLSLAAFIAFFFVFLFTIQAAHAAEITLAWDRNPESNIAGYKVYYGSESGAYSNVIDIGSYTSCTISGLEAGETYFIVATAYDTSGDESTYSGEIAYTVPANSAVNDSSGSDGGGAGCFIATAAYGSYIEPDVMVLREFRDKYLLTNPAGRAFVRFYYATSPPIARYIAKHETLRVITRWALTPLVYGVKKGARFKEQGKRTKVQG